MSEENLNQHDSMEAPEINTPEQKEIANYILSDIDNALSQLINLSDNILHEPTCLICCNAHREEIEQEWLQSTSHQKVKKLIKDKSGIALSNDVIDNHMVYHLDRGVKELQKIEYADRIKRLNAANLTTLDRLRLCFSALTERLMNINSITPSGDMSVADVEKIKSAETSRLMASFNQLLKLQASILGEMKNNGEIITIPRQSFMDFFDNAILNAKNDEEKQIISDILNGLASLGKTIQ